MWFLLSLDDEATAWLRNVENYPPKDTASEPTSIDTSATPLSEPQFSCRCGGVAGRGGGGGGGGGGGRGSGRLGQQS